MVQEDVIQDRPLAAGDFAAWLAGMERALDSGGDGQSVVPCGGCTACCTSSQFVHIGPEEAETLARIPSQLLFPAPGLPSGHVLLGYDEHGHCPMLGDGGCSIYEHRPRTCRTYDCRVFPAAGVEVDDEDQLPIARRARRWQFSFPAEVDRIRHTAVRAADRFVREHRDLLAGAGVPTNATQRAVLAVRLHGEFLRHDDRIERSVVVEPEPEAVRVAMTSPLGARGRAG